MNMPERLKTLKQWVCWRPIQRDNGKVDKIPVNPKNPNYNAKSNDPSSWSDFQTAFNSAKKNRLGIGFMFGNGVVGVDIDHCIDNGVISDMAKDVINTLDSYTEYSPSGSGIHIICCGTLPTGERRNGQLEMYDKGRFFTMTGRVLDDAHAEVEERTAELQQLHSRYMKKPDKKSDMIPTRTSVTGENYMDAQEIIRKAAAAKNGNKFTQLLNGNWKGEYTSQSNADMALCNMLAYWTGRDASMMDSIFRQSGLYRVKWDEKHGPNTYGSITIQEAIADCREVYQPKKQKENIIPPEPEDLALHLLPLDDIPEVYLPDPEDLSIENQEENKFSLDDIGNAERLIHYFGQDIRYCCTLGKWLIWSGKHWEPDEKGKIYQYARETARRIFIEVYKEKDDDKKKRISKHASSSCNHTRLKNMIDQAKSMSSIAISQSELDSNEWLLNCKTGTINLKTGKLQPHKREDLCTKIAPVEYVPDAKAPLWESFLKRIFTDNTEVINFIQRAVGYSLTGSTKEQCLFIAHGCGANGKSTFLDTIQDMLGDYAKNTSMSTFLAKQNDSQTNDIARLVGSRFVGAMEADEGKKLSESLVKQLTGGDKITARFLHKEFFDYVPSFKIWMGTNHMPVIKGTDNGIWRRVKKIPFEVTIPAEERDKDLPHKLLAELPGIFNWCLQGCITWQHTGLRPPREIEIATDKYRNDMDTIKAFLNDCCKRGEQKDRVSSTALYKVYQRWCDDNGEHALSHRTLSLKLQEKGMFKKNIIGHVFWEGISFSEMGHRYNTGASACTPNKNSSNEQLKFV